MCLKPPETSGVVQSIGNLTRTRVPRPGMCERFARLHAPSANPTPQSTRGAQPSTRRRGAARTARSQGRRAMDHGWTVCSVNCGHDVTSPGSRERHPRHIARTHTAHTLRIAIVCDGRRAVRAAVRRLSGTTSQSVRRAMMTAMTAAHTASTSTKSRARRDALILRCASQGAVRRTWIGSPTRSIPCWPACPK